MAFYETVSLRLQTLELMLDTSLMRTLLVYAESTAADVSNLVSALSEALGPCCCRVALSRAATA